MEEMKSEYRATPSLEDITVLPKKKGLVHTSMKTEHKSSRERHVELAAAFGVKFPQVPASFPGSRCLCLQSSVLGGPLAAGASEAERQ